MMMGMMMVMILLSSWFMMMRGILGVALVPALIAFGDSTVDVGNNNHARTLIRSNFYPYGRDFDTTQPTGRFSNGRLVIDYTAELLGFTSFPLPYLDPNARGKNLVIGVNFASAGSGFYDSTDAHFNVIPMSKQLRWYKEYSKKLANVVGKVNATVILRDALYVVSSGSSDFLQNYFIDFQLRQLYTVTQFSEIIIGLAINFIKELFRLGARRIGVVSLPPFGCLPYQRDISLLGNTSCVKNFNDIAMMYNKALNESIIQLPTTLHHLKVAYFDIFTPLRSIIHKPKRHGFTEARKACCGTGVTIMCHKHSSIACDNASQYVFWDGFHLTQAANEALASSLMSVGISLVF